MGKDEYDSLRPAADLRQELRDRIYIFIQNPLRWEGPEPSEEDRQIEYDAFADSLSRRLLALSTRRVCVSPSTSGSAHTMSRGEVRPSFEPALLAMTSTNQPHRFRTSRLRQTAISFLEQSLQRSKLLWRRLEHVFFSEVRDKNARPCRLSAQSPAYRYLGERCGCFCLPHCGRMCGCSKVPTSCGVGRSGRDGVQGAITHPDSMRSFFVTPSLTPLRSL